MSYPSIGTDVIFLSWPHLEYLSNAAYLLAPATLPLLAGFQLAFVAIPFVATGLGKWRDAGPFQPRQWTVDLSAPNTPPPDILEPWL